MTKEFYRDKIIETISRSSDRLKGEEMRVQKLEKILKNKISNSIFLKEEPDCLKVCGKVATWQEVLDACSSCVGKIKGKRVVNLLECGEVKREHIRMPQETDQSLDGKRPDVLIIGGGISGASIARELTKWKLSVMLVDKEADLAMQASGRNDGEVHPGVDLKKGSLKQKYVVKGNRMFDQICEELNVPFERNGQYVGFTNGKLRPILELYALEKRLRCKVTDTRIIGKEELFKKEPGLNKDFRFALYNSAAGCVCPYNLTIAYGENAVMNGAEVHLSTMVQKMDVKNGRIHSVQTNRGTIYPKLVINAAGVFAEELAKMAEDHFYSIHPRRGTNSILDKKVCDGVQSIASIKELSKNKSHSKGGGILRTVHHNLLIGPDAVETYEKENYATSMESIDHVFEKQKKTDPKLNKGDIITYFTGVRAATFEEDFVIEEGHRTKNLIHCAGIQSPGLTTAPAVAVDVAQMSVDYLKKQMTISKNTDFQPRRPGIVNVASLSLEDRDQMIKKNSDYGLIVCRCEEVSKGEILDALNSPICVPTVDGIKRRVRPGMGRCQGGFCMPLVMEIISEYKKIPIGNVRKGSENSILSYGSSQEVRK